jgi:hypothetical protein
MPVDGTLAACFGAKIRQVQLQGAYIESTKFHGFEEWGHDPVVVSSLAHFTQSCLESASGH